MPRMGKPESNTSCGALGAPGSVVDSGPPERMMPLAPNAAISAGSWSHAQISQYTPISRTRRAISCVYCAPKSRMRILSLWMSVTVRLRCAAGWPCPALESLECEGDANERRLALKRCAGPQAGAYPLRIEPIIRRFLRDLDVVRMRLGHAGAGHLHELRLMAHVLDGGGTEVTHRRTQATDQLMDDVAQRTAIRHATFDAFRHQLVGVRLILEVTILGAQRHRTQRTHAAVALVRAALEQLHVTRRFLGTREHRAQHHGGCAGGERL